MKLKGEIFRPKAMKSWTRLPAEDVPVTDNNNDSIMEIMSLWSIREPKCRNSKFLSVKTKQLVATDSFDPKVRKGFLSTKRVCVRY
jgi:hypothetical protein